MILGTGNLYTRPTYLFYSHQNCPNRLQQLSEIIYSEIKYPI